MKREPLYTIGGSETSIITMENIWRFLKKLKTELLYDPTVHFWLYIHAPK